MMNLPVFSLLSLFSLFQEIRPDFVKLDPFLVQAKYCYTHLIIYRKDLNFISTEIPVAISRPQYSYLKQDEACKPNAGNVGRVGRINQGICEAVRKNYHQKGIVCLAIGLVCSKRGSKDIQDAYWYITKYWSSGAWQDRHYQLKTIKKRIDPSLGDVIFSSIVIQAISTAKKEWGNEIIPHYRAKITPAAQIR